MLVQVTNNSQFIQYIDVVGNGDVKNFHALGPKAKEKLDVVSTERLEALKLQFGNKVLFKQVGGN